MAICGPKCSICWTLLSIWGIIQLALMGAFYQINSVTFWEDIGEVNSSLPLKEYLAELDAAYKVNATNCWIATACYGVTLLFALSQVYWNKRATAS